MAELVHPRGLIPRQICVKIKINKNHQTIVRNSHSLYLITDLAWRLPKTEIREIRCWNEHIIPK